jgi:hypothetical protein
MDEKRASRRTQSLEILARGEDRKRGANQGQASYRQRQNDNLILKYWGVSEILCGREGFCRKRKIPRGHTEFLTPSRFPLWKEPS